MATINIDALRTLLKERGQSDADDFLEITFLRPDFPASITDDEFQDRVLTVDCPYGTVTIVFDHSGQLRSLDVS